MTLVVQKYGGTSVGTLDRIRAVAAHIRDTRAKHTGIVVVVSAMGDRTDELLDLAHSLSKSPPSREVDMLLTAGERISMALLAIALADLGVTSQSLTGSQSGILTDGVHGNAHIKRISGERIRDAIKLGHVAIVAGFQGVCPETKEITTLGRGGSDLTAIALAHTLKADVCEIYKDVDGIMTADPRAVPEAKLLPQVSWATMSELSWSGSNVLHARGMHVATTYKIPIHIRSSFNLNHPGTLVAGDKPMESPTIHAFTHSTGLHWFTLSMKKSHAPSFVLQALAEIGDTPLIFDELTPHDKNHSDAPRQIRLLVSEKGLGKIATANLGDVQNHETNMGAIAIVGEGLLNAPDLLRKVEHALKDKPLHMQLSQSRILLALEQSRVPQALKDLHLALIKS